MDHKANEAECHKDHDVERAETEIGMKTCGKTLQRTKFGSTQ
jgi:hypothetical protein